VGDQHVSALCHCHAQSCAAKVSARAAAPGSSAFEQKCAANLNIRPPSTLQIYCCENVQGGETDAFFNYILLTHHGYPRQYFIAF
jgi:hypothetical protein